MGLSVSFTWDQACFCQPNTECAAFAEGNSPLVMPSWLQVASGAVLLWFSALTL